MSFVLDALRRADAERSRGAVPGLQAQPVLAPSASPAARRSGAAWLAAAALLLLCAAAATWWLLRAPARPAMPAAADAPASAPAPVAAAPLAAASVALPPPRIVVPAPPEPIPVPPAPAPKAAVAAAASPAASYPSKEAASAPARLPRLADLPPAVRGAIPPLQFGGAMDSPQPAARMLIVNGQVFREGDTLAPGLTLQTIQLRAAVFDYKGTRFEIAY